MNKPSTFYAIPIRPTHQLPHKPLPAVEWGESAVWYPGVNLAVRYHSQDNVFSYQMCVLRCMHARLHVITCCTHARLTSSAQNGVSNDYPAHLTLTSKFRCRWSVHAGRGQQLGCPLRKHRQRPAPEMEQGGRDAILSSARARRLPAPSHHTRGPRQHCTKQRRNRWPQYT